MPEVREFACGTAAYQQSLRLRHAVLRAPLGLALSEDDCRADSQQRHFAVFSADAPDEMLAVLLLQPAAVSAEGVACCVLRQMAVTPTWQGRGLGRRLLAHVEGEAWKAGCVRIELAARQTARGFYAAAGYRPVGSSYQRVGVEHINMYKLRPLSEAGLPCPGG